MSDRDAVRITTAPTSRAADIRRRQRRYVISMTIRTVCFVAAVAVGPGWLRWVLIAAALFLPYVAVVMANAEEQRDDRFTLPNSVPGHELEGPSAEPLRNPWKE
jgi:hypothetical protein